MDSTISAGEIGQLSFEVNLWVGYYVKWIIMDKKNKIEKTDRYSITSHQVSSVV